MIKVFGGVAAFAFTLAWGAMWYGVTLSYLWGWFMTPIFGLTAITGAQAYCVALVVQTANGWKLGEKDGESFEEVISKAIFMYPVLSAVTLLCGYIAKAFI